MFKALGSLFSEEPKEALESDIRYAIEHYLQDQLKTDQVLCHLVKKGLVEVRVGSAAYYQEVRLLEYELKQYLQEKFQYNLQHLRVIR